MFNGKIVRGMHNPIITALEYIREYCMKRIINVVNIIDKSHGSLTPNATHMFDLIKKEASSTLFYEMEEISCRLVDEEISVL